MQSRLLARQSDFDGRETIWHWRSPAEDCKTRAVKLPSKEIKISPVQCGLIQFFAADLILIFRERNFRVDDDERLFVKKIDSRTVGFATTRASTLARLLHLTAQTGSFMNARPSPSLLFAALALLAATAQSAPLSCALPQAPAAYLDLVSHTRMISASVGQPGRTMLFNWISTKNDIPDVFSSCRRTPVKIKGVDPFTQGSNDVQVMDYAPENSKVETLKTVLLLPPTGGENALDDAYADHLCGQGLRVVLVQHWANDTQTDLDLDTHDRGAMRSTAAIEDVIEFIHPTGANQLGVLGTSVGAITAAMMMGVESRISSAVMIVGGVGMPEIIGRSTEQTLTKIRGERLADPSFGLKSVDDYVKALSQHVLIEPLNFVNFARPKKTLFFMGMQDVTVPTVNQQMLYHALGDQELVTYDADHFHTILHTSLIYKAKIAQFFEVFLVTPTAEELAAPKEPVDGNKLCLNAKKP